MCVEEGGTFPSPQVERITITIKNQRLCVSIKRLPITLCVSSAKIIVASQGLADAKRFPANCGVLAELVHWDIMQ